MHQSALILGKRFFEIYQTGAPGRILDIGSRDFNGTLRPHAPRGAEYIGVDLEAGSGVDIVLKDPYAYPFLDKSFDWVISTSTLEHDKLFWLSFLEWCRILTDTGFIYINAPSNGSYHGYPQDFWRFYPDASLALQEWAQRMQHPIHLIESFIAPQIGAEWNDNVMIFTKDATFKPARYLSDEVELAHNIHHGAGSVRNLRLLTQDQVIIAEARQELARNRQ